MNVANIIISAVILVAIFWILYLYAVHRARCLVRQQLGILPEKKSEDVKTVNVLPTYQMADTTKDFKNTESNSRIESFLKKRKLRQKPPISSDDKSWAIPN